MEERKAGEPSPPSKELTGLGITSALGLRAGEDCSVILSQTASATGTFNHAFFFGSSREFVGDVGHETMD
jgi:hypothetical protein